ncbi:MAG: DMT family transporter [Chloroflexi bacterium]|nr:DMT family transporter [Chloroflexota bacterium]
MSRGHSSSGRWVYGLLLALCTAALWGSLPLQLKEVLKNMEPVTVTWYRLLGAGLILFLFLLANGRLPRLGALGGRGGGLAVLAIGGLAANYVLYVVGLDMLTPGTTQLVIQVAPILFLLGGVFIFREPFSPGQALGLLVLLVGFGLFFNQRLEELVTSLSQYTIGVLTILAAALLWAIYGLAQKQLLTLWNSVQVMMVIFLACAAVLAPWAKPLQVLDLSAIQAWLLLACALNTLIAYAAFAEALAHWEASRVSATLAVTPLITFVSVAIAATLWPTHVQPEEINGIGYAGAVLVVSGSALTALGPSLVKSYRDRRARAAIPL